MNLAKTCSLGNFRIRFLYLVYDALLSRNCLTFVRERPLSLTKFDIEPNAAGPFRYNFVSLSLSERESDPTVIITS